MKLNKKRVQIEPTSEAGVGWSDEGVWKSGNDEGDEADDISKVEAAAAALELVAL